MSKAFNKIVIGTLLAAATVGATVGAAAPAEARVNDGVAVLAGVAGLGLGAAIASDHPRHYYRDDGYYAPPPPPPRPIYYAPPPPPYGYGYGYGYVEHCRTFDRWNPYIGAYERVRRCR